MSPIPQAYGVTVHSTGTPEYATGAASISTGVRDRLMIDRDRMCIALAPVNYGEEGWSATEEVLFLALGIYLPAFEAASNSFALSSAVPTRSTASSGTTSNESLDESVLKSKRTYASDLWVRT